MADAATAGFKSLELVKLIEKTKNSVALEFVIPGASPYFDGHFPGFPILPAVAQAEIVLRSAAEHLGTGVEIAEIKRIKFSKKIKPDKPHLLLFEKTGRILSFKILSPADRTVYSSGAFILSEGSFCRECL